METSGVREDTGFLLEAAKFSQSHVTDYPLISTAERERKQCFSESHARKILFYYRDGNNDHTPEVYGHCIAS